MAIISTSTISAYFSLFKGNDRYVSSPYFKPNQLFTPGSPEWDTITGQERHIYETTGPVSVVINRKARLKSAGKWRHWRVGSQSDEELFDTPLLKFLAKPNPLQSKKEYLEELSIHRDVMGIAYIYALRGSLLQDIPSALWNITPELMSIQTTGKIYQQSDINEIISRITFNRGGDGEFNYSPEEILLRRSINTGNPVLPLSPLASLNMEISNIRAAMGYRNVIMRKKGAIGILAADQKDGEGSVALDPLEHKRIEKEYQSSWGISDKQMQVLISRYPLKWQPINYPTKDLLLFEEIDDNLRRVIDQYGLNENIFSIKKGSTMSDSGSKILEGERQAYQDTIIPESNDDAEAMSTYLGLRERGQYATLDYSHLPAMKDDEVKKAEITERKAKAYQTLTASGFSPVEARTIVGLEKDQ
jgi:phage portal protein BeeE